MATKNPNMIQIYCTKCGKKLAPDGRCAYCQILKKPKRQPIAKAVYDFCESPLTLVLAFFWTLTGILTLIFGLRTPLLSLPVDIAAILMIVGLWMLHIGRSKGKRTSMTLLSVSAVLAMVITSLTLIFTTLMGFFGIFITVSTSGHEDMLLSFTIAAVGLLFLLPLAALYLVRVNQLFLSARAVLRGSATDVDTSLFLTVFTMLLGVGYIAAVVKAGAVDAAYSAMLSVLLEVLPSGMNRLCSLLSGLSWSWIRPQLIASGIACLYSSAALIIYQVRIRAARRTEPREKRSSSEA